LVSAGETGRSPEKERGGEARAKRDEKMAGEGCPRTLALAANNFSASKNQRNHEGRSLPADARQPPQVEARLAPSADAGKPFSYVARPIAPCRRASIAIAVGRGAVSAAATFVALQRPGSLRSVNPSPQSLHARRKTPCDVPPRSSELPPSRKRERPEL
jgi:hypothetical protein